MWIDTSFPLDEADEVVLSFTPPMRFTELTLFARVRRVAEELDGLYGVGLEFENMSLFEQKMLAEALRGIPPRFPGHSGVFATPTA